MSARLQVVHKGAPPHAIQHEDTRGGGARGEKPRHRYLALLVLALLFVIVGTLLHLLAEQNREFQRRPVAEEMARDLLARVRMTAYLPVGFDRWLMADTEDPWGRRFQAERRLEKNGSVSVIVRSAGPDGKFGNKDDVTASVPLSPTTSTR